MNLQKSFISKFNYPTWVLILLCVTIYFFTRELYGLSDFRIFYMASEDFMVDVNMYETNYVNGLKYYYSPMFALTLGLFTFLDAQIVGWIWTVLNILMVYKIWKLSMEYFDLSFLTKNEIRNLSLLAFFFGIGLIYYNLHNHQMTIFLVWGILFSLKMNEKGGWLIASAILAFIINVKIIPIVIIPYLIYRAHWKLLFGVLGFFILFLLLPSIVVGYDHNIELHKSWWTLLNPQNTEHLIDASEPGLSSLTTFFPVFLMDSADWDYKYAFSRNFMSLSAESVIIIIQVARALVLLLTFYFLRSIPFRKESSKLKQFWELSYIMAAAVLIFPHQQIYGFFMIWPLLIYLSYYLIISKRTRSNHSWWLLLTTFVLFTLCISSNFLLGEWRELWSYIKLVTWGTLFILPFFFYVTPKKIKEVISKIS